MNTPEQKKESCIFWESCPMSCDGNTCCIYEPRTSHLSAMEKVDARLTLNKNKRDFRYTEVIIRKGGTIRRIPQRHKKVNS